MSAVPIHLDIYRTAIPMRSFEHAAAARDVAEAVVVGIRYSDGRWGWGETLPRPYVTGEGLDSVIADLKEVHWPAWAGRDLDNLAGLPDMPAAEAQGRCVNAAACAMDLAALRRLLPHQGPPAQALIDAAGRPAPRPAIATRVSGVLGSADPARTARRLRLMRLYGLRDFKLKLGFDGRIDAENLRLVHRRIGKAVAAGRCTLRVDVNGGWDAASTPQRVAELAAFGVCVVEQPVFCPPGQLVELARRCSLPLMADESLLSEQDARLLLDEPRKVWWNIRLSKNGGFLRCLRLARLAEERGVPFTLGCMVGESSILSAAQRRLLEWCPPPRFVEGNYGRFLLAGDLVAKPLRFSHGGRLKVLGGAGWDIHVQPQKLARYGQLVAHLEA